MPRLTPNMKVALERLYGSSGQSDFVVLSTALALERRQLVSMPAKLSRRSSGGQFPEYKVSLTLTGQNWCEINLPNILRNRA